MREKAHFYTEPCNATQCSFCLQAHLGLGECLWGLKWEEKGGREDCKQRHCFSRWETSVKL